MSDEVDIAMAYSEERKMRMAAMERINGMMYDLVPLVGRVDELISATLKQDADEIASCIKGLTRIQSQVEAGMMLNLFRPVDGVAFFPEDQIRKINSLNELSPKLIESMRARLEASSRRNFKEWNTVAEEIGHMSVKDRFERHKKDILMEMVAIKHEEKDTKEGRSQSKTDRVRSTEH